MYSILYCVCSEGWEQSAQSSDAAASEASDDDESEANSSSSSSAADSSGDEGSDKGHADLDASLPLPPGQEPGTEDEELARQYAEAVAQDQIALASIKDRATKEQTKGSAVLHQKQLWEQNLELRILLQRCLQAANRMPHAASHAAVLSADQGLAQGYAGLVATASDVIDEMLALHSALVEQHPAAQQSAEASVAANGKRQRQEAEHGDEGVDSAQKWQRIDEEYRKLVPFRDASVDRWHRKTMLISGAGAVKGNLRALNQSVSSQVALLMKDPTRLARRCGVSAQQRPRVLCQSAQALAEPSADGVAEPASGLTQQKDVAEQDELDLDAFDDGEFYAQLLKEFLDSNSNGNLAAAGGYPQGKKKRKQVDRRASKGRKLRYHVQEKLVNFTAPVEHAGHSIATQLFSSLFGGSKQS
ncbi:TPA: hypothetical protein ACH3X3_003386 [Trebouxia sp. C0006]